MISKSLPRQQPPVTQVFEAHYYPSEGLVWRQRKLIVRVALATQPVVLPSVAHQAWLTDCLMRSPVTLVALDPNLGIQRLTAWADACEQAQKLAFLRLPSTPARKEMPGWRRKLLRSLECLAAGALLLLLSPLMGLLAVLIRLDSPGPICCGQWHVGNRGQLFRLRQFRTIAIDSPGQRRRSQELTQNELLKPQPEVRLTRLGRWLRKSGWNQLPLLLHVLRGEMSFSGAGAASLETAAQMAPEFRRRLNTCPGMVGTWQHR